MKSLVWPLAIGTAITLALFGLGYVAAEQGAQTLSYALYWQAYLLYMALPCSTLGVFAEPACESMAAAKLAFYAGLPLGVLVYSLLAWTMLALRRRVARSGN